MHIYYRPFTDPYINIAAEEYFIKNTSEDICMIWINQPSVIIGKHQNAYAEINYPYTTTHNIPVIRRISGGGAVYHDMGNVNFTFIKQVDKSYPVDFSRFTNIIVDFMQSLGIKVETSKRNSLFIGDLKFSGHAEHVFHDKVLHHGTILFETDLQTLNSCLQPEKLYMGKAPASVRSHVGNIASLLPHTVDIQKFIDLFIEWLQSYFNVNSTFALPTDAIRIINQLVETKYKTWGWNYGYSPVYNFHIDIPTKQGGVRTEIKVENGKFAELNFPDNRTNNLLISILRRMTGIMYKEDEINTFVKNNLHELELAGVKIVNFKNSFFR